MLTYKAMYKFLSDGVHGEVHDFPGVITYGRDLDEARSLLAGALIDMSETSLMAVETLPMPDPTVSRPDADLEEPIHLILKASSTFMTVPTYEAA